MRAPRAREREIEGVERKRIKCVSSGEAENAHCRYIEIREKGKRLRAENIDTTRALRTRPRR